MLKLKTTIAALTLLLISACAPAASPTPTSAAPKPGLSTTTLAAPSTPTASSRGNASQSSSGNEVTFVLVPDKSKVSYAVDETFLNENNRLNTAVGTTNQASGQFTVDLKNPSNPQFGDFIVDISTLTTDSSRRDNAIRRQWLESSRFPTAKFSVTELVDFPANPQEGQDLKFKMNGDLTVRDATHPVSWDVTATLNGNTLTGKATTSIMMADWGVTPPNIGGILIVKDGVLLTIEFVFARQS
jgi:polyisoprenoid-binding protein YceI